MTITIDSNLINVRQRDSDINSLELLHKAGKIKIVGTERLLEEMKAYNTPAFNKASGYENVSEPFTVGVSRIGRAYFSSDDDSLPTFRELCALIFPGKDFEMLTENEQSDIMHLVAHTHSKSDVFVTNNTRDFMDGKRTNSNRNEKIIDRTRVLLKSKFNIEIRTPNELLNELGVCSNTSANK